MEHLFQAINNIFDFVIPVSDFFWDFPTNFSWYASIPILGNFSLAVILLIGSGIYFTLKTGFIQVTHFGKGIRILAQKKRDEIGISSLAAFFLSSAMRVGAGKYSRSNGSHCSRRARRVVLDVGFRFFRNGYRLYGGRTGSDF